MVEIAASRSRCRVGEITRAVSAGAGDFVSAAVLVRVFSVVFSAVLVAIVKSIQGSLVKARCSGAARFQIISWVIPVKIVFAIIHKRGMLVNRPFHLFYFDSL